MSEDPPGFRFDQPEELYARRIAPAAEAAFWPLTGPAPYRRIQCGWAATPRRQLRHLKRRPVLVTANKPLAALGQVLHDGDLAEAILDRLRERGTHYVLRGRSYRTRHLKEESATTAEDAA